MKYANLEKNTNKILGWYDKTINKDIPTPNIEVSDEVWQDALNINANYYENGKFIHKDFRTDEELEQIRINAINQKTNEVIEAKYPLYKQLNIRGKLLKDETTGTYYNDTDIEIMDMFIDTARGIAKTAKANGTQPEDIDWAEIDKRMAIFLASLEKTE